MGQIIAYSSWGRHEEGAVDWVYTCYSSGRFGMEGMQVLQGGTEPSLCSEKFPGAASLEPGELGSDLLG